MNKKVFFVPFDFKNSLFAKLFTSLILVFISAFLIITATWYTNMNKLIYKNTLSHMTDIINSSNNQFEDNLKNISSCIETIASVDTTINLCTNGINNFSGVENFQNYISGYYDIYATNIYGIAVLDTKGNCFSTGIPYISDDYTNTDWFNKILSNKGKCCFILRNIYGQNDAVNNFSVGCAVMNGSVPVGVVLIDIRTSLFIKSFGTSKINGATRTIIAENENNIVFCNDILLSDTQINTLIKKATSEDLFNKIREIKFNDITYIFTAQKSSYTKWTNITFFPKSFIDSEYKTALSFSLLWVLIGLLLTILIASIISFYLSKKINKLVEEIKSIDLENIDKSVDKFESSSNYEIRAISSTLSKMTKTISAQFKEIQTLSEEKRISDIRALKSQINPHFLYNTLNVIETLADIHGNTKISTITKSLINLMHYSINDSSSLVTIQCELDYIKNYMEIMQTKFLGHIHVVYDIEDGLEKCLTLKMIFQPIVENCIKHALTGNENEYILIKVSKPDKNIEIKIIDNGKGIYPEKLSTLLNPEKQNGQHLGLANVNKRIKLTFGEQYGINILSVPHVQTAVIINIPFIEE